MTLRNKFHLFTQTNITAILVSQMHQTHSQESLFKKDQVCTWGLNNKLEAVCQVILRFGDVS